MLSVETTWPCYGVQLTNMSTKTKKKYYLITLEDCPACEGTGYRKADANMCHLCQGASKKMVPVSIDEALADIAATLEADIAAILDLAPQRVRDLKDELLQAEGRMRSR